VLLQLSDLSSFFEEPAQSTPKGSQMAQAPTKNDQPIKQAAKGQKDPKAGARKLTSARQASPARSPEPSFPSITSGPLSSNGEFSAGNITMVLCGLVVLLIALPMICLNERRLAKIWHVLSRAKHEVEPKTNIHKVSWVNNFKLVHCVGKCNTDKPVRDERFNVTFDQTIRLIRRVEML